MRSWHGVAVHQAGRSTAPRDGGGSDAAPKKAIGLSGIVAVSMEASVFGLNPEVLPPSFFGSSGRQIVSVTGFCASKRRVWEAVFVPNFSPNVIPASAGFGFDRLVACAMYGGFAKKTVVPPKAVITMSGEAMEESIIEPPLKRRETSDAARTLH